MSWSAGVLRLLLFLLAVLSLAAASPAEGPLRRMDRMWAVGAPVLEEGTASGIYVWVQDKALQLAANPGRKKRGVFRVRVRGTRPLGLDALGDFSVVGRRGSTDVVLQAQVRQGVGRGKITCEGDVTFSDVTIGGRGARLRVGPLAKRAAKSIVVGRF